MKALAQVQSFQPLLRALLDAQHKTLKGLISQCHQCRLYAIYFCKARSKHAHSKAAISFENSGFVGLLGSPKVCKEKLVYERNKYVKTFMFFYYCTTTRMETKALWA